MQTSKTVSNRPATTGKATFDTPPKGVSIHPDLQECLKLEGEQKIIDHTFLELRLEKVMLLGVPLAISIFGLYFLVKYATFRSKVLFRSHSTFDQEKIGYIIVTING